MAILKQITSGKKYFKRCPGDLQYSVKQSLNSFELKNLTPYESLLMSWKMI